MRHLMKIRANIAFLFLCLVYGKSGDSKLISTCQLLSIITPLNRKFGERKQIIGKFFTDIKELALLQYFDFCE